MGKKNKNRNTAIYKCRIRKGKYRKAEIVTHQNGSMDLVLPDISEQELQQNLPCVSIVTITKDRGAFVGIMLYNWINITYPREKLEWVILDDSKESTYNLQDYLPPDDPYIKYVKLDRWYPVAEKRNKAVELASHEFIVHMDDDDYYFPDHVLAKIRLILQYNCQGVHSLPIGVYDMMEKSSYIFDPTGKGDTDTNDVAEATLAYRKDYWRNHKFVSDNPEGMGEGRSFIGNKFSQWIKLHFMFNMISITHSQNITGHGRRFINENLDSVKTGRFEDIFPPAFKLNLDNIRKILVTGYVQPDIPAQYKK
uniref:Glycosyl transferase family 2 n=1 Tax=Marseillevirus LCMAC201 TaxID=2506605 RepID=A0A481YX95_9VIRU|nr:MAG: glycosyl transferase family 2 [Marseillevirus LCMAC201]